MGFSTRYGGQIGKGMQEGGPAGFIGGPQENYRNQTTIADDIPLEVKDGTFVINAPAVEYAGSDDISEMLTKAYEAQNEEEIKRLKLNTGSIVFFPSNFMYPHSIEPITKGTRYSIVAWLQKIIN